MKRNSIARVKCVAFAAAAGGCLLAGCQRYEKSVVDAATHRQMFESRTLEAAMASPSVAEFARTHAKSNVQNEPRYDLIDGLSLAEAQAVALVFNPALRRARLQAGLTQADIDTAGLWEDPSLGVDITRIIESVDEPWKIMGSIGLTLPISGRLAIERKLAAQEHQAELARVAREEWRVRMDLRAAWVRCWSANTGVQTATQHLEKFDDVIRIITRMEELGEMSRTEARLFRIERANADLELQRLRAQAIDAAADIAAIMGVAPRSSLQLESDRGIDAVFAEASIEGQPTVENVDVFVAHAEYEASERELELAIRGQYPDLMVGPGLGREDGQDQILLGLSLPLPVLNRNRKAIAQAQAKRSIAIATVQSEVEQAVSETAAASMQLQMATARRLGIETDIVPLVDAEFDDATKLATLGEVNAIVLLESLKLRQEAKMRWLDERTQEALAAIRLITARGSHEFVVAPVATPTQENTP